MEVTWLLPCSYTVLGALNHTKAINHPLPGKGLGRHGKAPTGYGIYVDSAKASCWVWGVWVGLQPNSHVCASLLSLYTHSGQGCPKADVAGQQRPQLAVCLHSDEHNCGPCAFVEWGTHWHYDWWLTHYEHLQPPEPTTGAEATTMWRPGGLPWGG